MLQQCEQGVDHGHGDAGVAARQRIDFQREDQAHDGVGQCVAHACGVREQQVALQQLELLAGYAGLGEQAEAGVDAVRGIADGNDLVYQRAGDGNAAAVVRRQAQGDGLLVDSSQAGQREFPGANVQNMRH